jgi:hypothetical protein
MHSLAACRKNREGCKRSEGATSLCPGGARRAPYGYAPPACLPLRSEGAPEGGAPLYGVESCQPVPRRGAARRGYEKQARKRYAPVKKAKKGAHKSR